MQFSVPSLTGQMSWLRAVFPEDSAVSFEGWGCGCALYFITRSMSFGNVHAEACV